MRKPPPRRRSSQSQSEPAIAPRARPSASGSSDRLRLVTAVTIVYSLRPIVVSLVGDGIADDVLQDFVLFVIERRLHRRFDSSIASPRGYFAGYLRMFCRNYQRSRVIVSRRLARYQTILRDRLGDAFVETDLVAIREEIAAILGNLTESEREAIMGVLLSPPGKTTKVVAIRLGVSEAAARQRLSRMRKRLRSSVELLNRPKK